MPTNQGDETSAKNDSKALKPEVSIDVDGETVVKKLIDSPSAKAGTIFQFPTVVNGQMTFSGVPVKPIAAALGQPIPADQVCSVASQLTSHMSSVASPMMSPKQVTSPNTS